MFDQITSKIKKAATTFDRQVWTLFAGNIINVLGTSLVMPFLSIYMYEKMGISMTDIGLAFLVATILGAVTNYIGGSMCDEYGRKKVFVTGLMLQVLAYFFIIYALDIKASYFMMLFVLSVNSMIDGFYRPAPDVMIADVDAPEKRIEAYGLLRVGANLGWIIGPIIGGLLAFYVSYASMFYITALTTFIYLLLAIFWLRDTHPLETKEKVSFRDIIKVARDTPFMLYCLISMLMEVVYMQMYSPLSVYSSSFIGMNELEVGLLFSISGLLVVVFQFPISMAVKRYRMSIVLSLAASIFALGFGLISLSRTAWTLYGCICIITVGEMLWSPASATISANLSPEDKRGRYFGFSGLMLTFGIAFGPLFGGVLMDSSTTDMPRMWIVVGAVFIVCAVLFWALTRFVPAGKNRGDGRLEAPIEVKA
jgi:MFS family permease